MTQLKKRVIELKFTQGENHIGSCISAVNIIKQIYDKMKKEDIFILSAGHAAGAWYIILEDEGKLPKGIAKNLGTHPEMNKDYGIYCTTGSLGHGIGIAVGAAIASPLKDIYCLLTDGECAEGSVWEALSIADEECLHNLHVYVNANGWSALSDIDIEKLEVRLKLCFPLIDLKVVHTNSDIEPYLKDLDSHYKSLTREQYAEVIRRKLI